MLTYELRFLDGVCWPIPGGYPHDGPEAVVLKDVNTLIEC